MGNPWQYEVAAILSQLGCVTLAPETIEAVYRGDALSEQDRAQYDAHPGIASSLLSKIPRLEPIAWMIEHQNRPVDGGEAMDAPEMKTGAEILRLVLEYEQMIHRGTSRTEAAHQLAMKNKFRADFFEALVALDPNAEDAETRRCRIEELTPGMVIQQEVRCTSGALLISRGQEVTPTVIFKLKNFQSRRSIAGDVLVSMPKTTLAFVKGA
ncbi:MAG TPA: HD domain-containing phosphohydrolase [Candidatus Sulfotelmatobacter sp.]|nr:HD domain-containing phosphohydrolase [Candidatus Sulfotelmatobacter sp.]